MEKRLNLNLDGLPMHHMRRIGKPATKDGVVSVMDFYRTTYMIGRSAVQVDFYIDSERHIQSASLSRCHARVVRQAGNQHKLYDDSLNGVFVNNIKIAGSCVLREGDKVTFGHPCGARLPAGSKSRQPDSDNQFMFEMCSCERKEENEASEKTSKEASGFKKPGLPTESTGSKTYRQLKRAARQTTQCFSPGDIRQLKKAWEDRQSGSSTSESSDAEDTNEMGNRQTYVKTNRDMIKPVAAVQSDEEEMDMETSSSIEGKGSGASAGARGKDAGVCSNECKTLAKAEIEDTFVGRTAIDRSSLSQNSANIQNNVNENVHVEGDNRSNSDKKCSFDDREDLTALEGTFNSIMKDLCALRGNVEYDNSPSSQHVPLTPKKSPTKDACIQTSQIETGANIDNRSIQTVFSPTKEMAIQTSQTMFSEEMDGSKGEYRSEILSECTERPVSELSESVQEMGSQNSIDTDHLCEAVKEDKESEYANNSEQPFSTSTDKKKDFKQDISSSAKTSVGVYSDTINRRKGRAEVLCFGPDKEDFNQETTHADKESVTSESDSVTNENNVDEKEKSCLNCDVTFTGTKRKLVEEITSAEGKTLKLTEREEYESECTLIEKKEKSVEVEMNSKEIQNKEVSKCILMGYKEGESDMDEMPTTQYSQNIENGDVLETTCKDGPSLILSDSVVYEEDEDSRAHGIELSNSVEFTDSEREMDISDSETDDHRQDDLEAEKNNTSEFGGQDSETLESNHINATDPSNEGKLNPDYDDKTSQLESECGILSENCRIDDTEMQDVNQTKKCDNTGIAVLFNKNVDVDKSLDYEGLNNEIANEEICSGGEITTENENTCLGLEDCNRKRKFSYEVIDHTETETQRKRHCSNDMNVILNDKNMTDSEHDTELVIESISIGPSCNDNANEKDDCNENIGYKETEEVSDSNDTPVSDEETKCSSDRQSTLHKFKKGVKRFFKFWSKKSYELVGKSGGDVGYTYIQDKAGHYKLLELQCPYKISVSTESLKDVPNENSDDQIHTQSWTDDNNMNEKTSGECMGKELLETNDKELEEKTSTVCMEQAQSETVNEDLHVETNRICMEQDQSGLNVTVSEEIIRECMGHNQSVMRDKNMDETTGRECMEQDQSVTSDKDFYEITSRECIEHNQNMTNDKGYNEITSRECIEHNQNMTSDKDFNEITSRECIEHSQNTTNDKDYDEITSRECIKHNQNVTNDTDLDEFPSRECIKHDQNVTNDEDLDEAESRGYMKQEESKANEKDLEEMVSRVCKEQDQSEDRDYAFDDKSEESQERVIVVVSCENVEEKKQRLREDVCLTSTEEANVTEALLENDQEVTTVTDEKSLEAIKKNSEDFSEIIKNSNRLLQDKTSSSQENVDSDVDRVETSICQTDNEIDPDDMIKTSVLISALSSNFQSTNDRDQTSWTTLPDTCNKENVIASQSQSPIIAKQGELNDSRNDIHKANNSIKRLFDNAKSQDDASSQLSCRFSDDDEDDFLSPEIDFNHLDDSEDDFVKDSESDTDLKQNQDVLGKVESGDESEIEQDSESDTDLKQNQDILEKVESRDESEIEQDSESDTDLKQNQDILEEVESGDESEKEQDKEHLEEKTYHEKNVYQSKKDEGNKKITMDDESNTNMDDNTSDPLENYINHDTEDDSGSEYTDTENVREESTRVDIDFDFCDSESDKELLEITKLKRSEKNNSDNEDMDEHASIKQVAKRKIESDTDDRSPKRKRNRAKFAEKLAKISTPDKETNTLHSTFKTPSFVRTRTQMFSNASPDQFSCTQLMDSSQALDLDCLTATQASRVTEQLEVKARDNSRPKTSRNKAKDLLEKLRAKRRIKEERVDDPPSSDSSQSTSGSTEVIYSHTREQSRALAILEDVDKHVNSCRTVVNKLKAMLDGSASLKGNPRVHTWKQELAEVEKKFDFPKTVIALVGDTGSGKSSLMNAILDHRSVLPTSGIRACTAVVVEVVNNTTSNNFEADIEFLQRKEWMEELQVLIKDLTARDGTVKNRQPDPASDAFISYCKVKAVYGRIDRFEVLSRLTTVTHWLGRVKVVKSTNPEDFRKKVEKYIETQEPGAGGQYWPIVKHVRLRMPNCDVCSSGAALVDLPGVRDSNAARDRIAKEYLKNCTAVWVVSIIDRAIDNKTAKELLGENFRRQLLMDGQYGSVAFICTKSDAITPSEIIRPLNLEGKTKVHEDQICKMDSQKCEMEVTVSKATAEMGKLRKKVKELKKEAQELHDNLGELKSLLDPDDLESSQSEEKEAVQEYEQELKEKEEELAEAEERMDELHDEKLDASQKILELEKKLNIHRKAIAAICAKARNEYARTEIRRDFKTGLKEMKRRAGMLNDDDEEEDIYVDDDDDDDVGSSAENLRVFCCSSTEYQKMRKLLTEDGLPLVFSSLEETQIPALRHYVHEMTSIRRKQWLERLIRSVGRLVFDLQIYICESRDMKSRDRMFAKSTIDSELKKFDATLAPVFQKLSSDIDGVFDGKIRQKIEEGAANATSEANSICAKWSAPFVKDKTKDKRSGGLHLMTYGATVRREGVYSSRSYGHVDFNEDLAEPVYRSMTIVWDKAFSGMLWKILDELKSVILSKLKGFTCDLVPVLEQLGIQRIKTLKVSSVIQNSASNKLTEMVAYLKEIITNKQRDISRIISPHIQSSLLPAYNSCVAESGSGMYARMKSIMSKGIDTKRFTMFDEATQQLMKHLVDLQTEIVQYVRLVFQSLIQDLQTAFEPLWEAPSNTSVMRSAFHQAITEVCASVQQIYEQAGIPQTEERALVPVPTSSVSVSSTAPMSAGGSNRTLAGCRKEDDWQNFENTFQRKQDTPYGMIEQCGRIGVRVKTERLSQNSVTETVETLSRVQTLHVKQENQDEQQSPRGVDQSSSFGCQTLQDLQCGRLEMFPVADVMQTMPASSATSLKELDTATSSSQSGGDRCIGIGGSSAGGHSDQSREGNWKCLVLGKVPVKQPVTATTSRNTTSRNNLSGQNVSQQANMKNLVTEKKKEHIQCVELPSKSICVPVTKSSPSDLLQSSLGKLVQTAKHATAAVEMKSCKVTQGTSLISRPRKNPTLKLVAEKENVSADSGNKRETIFASQPFVNRSSFTKGEKKLGGGSNVELTRKDTETRSMTSPVTVKTEPADRGVYGRVKYLGTIDLTDD